MWSLFTKKAPPTVALTPPPPNAPDYLPLPDDGRFPVAGESHYQPALFAAARGRVAGQEFDEHLPVTAALTPEPENEWDHHAVRVDVLIDGKPFRVGYLPRELAAEYQPSLLALGERGFVGTCAARITGGGERFYGIYLHVSRPRDLRVALGLAEPFVARRTEGAVLLHNDWSCTVTQEHAHQDVLARYAPAPGGEPRAVIASLCFCLIGSGKYRGQEAIEVRLDGARVGELTHAMSQRYGDRVRALTGQGLAVTCEAFTIRTARGVEVGLRMPPGR
ncbi:HIRAN domain-containing protein [Amycolatopsis sp. NBC_01480]|uniref:HIRAN domain-containing protein n=1 Tax=Amycolatopsis sp. NBC_01480 TaxID=2903562 RepID=UPI002E293D99|nr:HIRAN domain-containing protein [Amycolatopsis sp. NBC_01480]